MDSRRLRRHAASHRLPKRAGLWLVALLLAHASAASAQAPVALPLSIHVAHGADGPIAEDAYVDYAVELANRWLRPAGICVFPASRHPLSSRGGPTGDAVAVRQAGRSIPVVIVDRIRRADATDGSAGWGRNGRRPLVLMSTEAARPFTLAHELGHVLGQAHVADAQDVMHRSSPSNYERLLAPPIPTARATEMRAAARRLQRRMGTHPSAHCATPRALPHPSTLASGHPALIRTRRVLQDGLYEGEQFFGTYHGHGRREFRSGYRHEGAYRLGRRHGLGEEWHASGSRYRGAFADDDRHGFGTFHYASGAVYRGEYVQNQRHGRGMMVWTDGGTYVGQYRHNRPHGQGRKTWASGSYYQGAWRAGLEHGQGVRRYADGDVYEGPFVDGHPEGHGRYRFASGSLYEGPLRRGRFHGRGQLRYQNGGHYRGSFEGGRRHGHGRYRSADGTVYEGPYHRGERHGAGTVRWRDGRSERRRYHLGRWLRG